MTLDKSGSKKSVGKNIGTEVAAGKPYRVARAIALSVQDRALGRPSPPRRPKRRKSAR